MDRLTEPCGPNHFRVCGNKTVYNCRPPKSSRVSYALAKLFRLEEQAADKGVQWKPNQEPFDDSPEGIAARTQNNILDSLYALYDTINRSEHDVHTAYGVLRAISEVEAMKKGRESMDSEGLNDKSRRHSDVESGKQKR